MDQVMHVLRIVTTRACSIRALKRQSNQELPQLAKRTNNLRALLLALGLGLSTGCDIPDRHDIAILRRPAVWEIESKPSFAESTDAKLSSRMQPNEKKVESDRQWQAWYLHHFDPIGFVGGVMMQSEVIADQAQENSAKFKVTLNERLVVYPVMPTPGEDTDAVEAGRSPNPSYCLTANEQTFWHDEEGNLLKVACTARRGFAETSKTIVVSSDQILIDSTGALGGKTTSIAHTGPVGGPLHVYLSMPGNPIQKGEVRRAQVLLPIHEQLARLRVQGSSRALAKRLTPEGIGSDSLNEAIGLISVGNEPHRERYYWYDDEGTIQTTQVAGEPRFTYRCDQSLYEKANEKSREQSHPIMVDVPGESIAVKTSGSKLSGLVFDVELLAPEAKPDSSEGPRIRPAPRQYTQRRGNRGQRVVTAAEAIPQSRLNGQFQSMTSASTKADMEPTQLVDYRSAELRGVLATIQPIRNLPKEELAQEINRTVHALLSFDQFATGVQPARYISRSTRSDSTEHAIMLVTMLRASGIPARLVFGLKHSPEDSDTDVNRFVNHAWVVAEVNDQWVALDPTTGQSTTAECLALEINDLSTMDADTMVDHFLSLLRSFHITVHRVMSVK